MENRCHSLSFLPRTLAAVLLLVLLFDHHAHAGIIPLADFITLKDGKTPRLRISARARSQTITFPPVAAKPFDSPPVRLLATASSGLPITYSILSGPASVNGDLLTFTSPGVATVLATQSGNSEYSAAGLHLRNTGTGKK